MPTFTLILTVCLFAAIGVAGEVPPLALIPQPERVERRGEPFQLTAATRIAVAGKAPELRPMAERLAVQLRQSTGLPLPVVEGAGGDGGVTIADDGDAAALGAEGYTLEADAHGVRIIAATAAGAFHGVQTLLQLLPVEAFGRDLATRTVWTVPGVAISDQPRFRWRGLMLDSGRNFFGRDTVCRMLDAMALHKFNVLHLHLTEDQGWRIQLQGFPKLTEFGSIRASSPTPGERAKPDGIQYGPWFYTQDDIRAIVAYAKARFITVVPEIEMPGHSMAALACYPELSCTGGPFKVRSQWGVEPDVYCAGNDATFAFLEKVLDEVCELFPGEYIHIGGDECPKARWKTCAKCQARIKAEGLKDEHDLQSWFIRRIAKHLAEKGRKLIGWDEILEGSPIPGATVTVWRDAKSGTVAAQRGGDVIMCPTSHCYFDYRQSRDASEPESIGGLLSVETVHAFDPMPPGIPAELVPKVIGVQGNLWTEYIRAAPHLEYMTWPRGAALAEVAWSPAARPDWSDFRARLAVHQRRFDLLGVNHRSLGDGGTTAAVWRWTPQEVGEEQRTIEVDLGKQLTAPGACRFTFRFTGGKHRLEMAWAALLVDGKEVARDTHPGSTGASNRFNTYALVLAERPANATVILRAAVRSDGGNDSRGELLLER